MKTPLKSGDTPKISGFGSILVKKKADRRGRNPQTVDAITIEAQRVMTFKPSTMQGLAINGEIA